MNKAKVEQRRMSTETGYNTLRRVSSVRTPARVACRGARKYE